VARKYRNESYRSVSIDNQHDKSREHNISKVKIPCFFKVSFLDKIGEYTSGKKSGKPIYGTDERISKEPFPKEWDIVKIEPVEIKFLNKCPKCGKEGRPRVDKKNNDDYTHYNRPSNREEEYRLIYNHKTEDGKVKPCITAKYDEENGTFTKTGKISGRITDYIFPNYLIDRNI